MSRITGFPFWVLDEHYGAVELLKHIGNGAYVGERVHGARVVVESWDKVLYRWDHEPSEDEVEDVRCMLRAKNAMGG